MNKYVKKFHESHKKKINNSIWLLVEKFILLFVEFLVVALVARSLGVSDYGVLAFILAVISFLTPFTVFGLSGVLVRYSIDRNGYSLSTIISSAIMLRVFASSFIFLILFIFSDSINLDTLVIKYILILAACELVKSFNSVGSWFESELKSEWTAKVRVLTILFTASLKLYGVMIDKGWEYFVIVQGIETIVHSILLVYIFYIKSEAKIGIGYVNITLIKEYVVKGFPLLISSIGAIIYLKSDVLMVKYILGEHSAGIYSAATRVSELTFVIPVIFIIAIFPIMMKYKNNEFLSREFGKKILAILFYGGFIIMLGMLVFSSHIIHLLYGLDFSMSAVVLSVHCMCLPFVFTRAYISKWIITKQVYYISLISQLSGALSNIVGNYFLIPIYGEVGAATATIISLACASFLPLLLIKQSRVIAIDMLLSPIYPILRFYNAKYCS